MNKNDFLEILRDYLKGTFSELEINDILRDYEEFFLNGELQDKSDEEIIKGLGSPKSIAKELTEEMNGESAGLEKNNSEIKDKVNKEAKRVWKNVKITGRKAGNKTKEFLDSNSVINGSVSSAGIKLIIALITCLLIIPAIPVVFTMLGILLSLVGMSIANFIGYLGAAILCGVNLSMGVFGFFACIAWTGFTILGWVLYSLAYKGLKYLVVTYISWVRTRKMYVRVKDQQGQSINNDDNINEENMEVPVFEEEIIKTTEVLDMNSEENTLVEPFVTEEINQGLEENDEDNKEGRRHDE